MATTVHETEAPLMGSTGLPLAFRGVLWAAIGFLIGTILMVGIRLLVGLSALSFEPVVVVGYIFALLGWFLGVGVWETWAKGWLGLPTDTYSPAGTRKYLGFNMDHKVIGIQYGVTFIVLFLIAGLLAMTMRAELIETGRTIFGPASYNRVMSLHGLIMVLVAVTAVPGAFGNYIMPLQVGAEDMAFPRLNAMSFWFWPPVAALLIGSQFVGGWDSGWTGYVPLAEVNRPGQLFYALAFITAGLSSIVAAVNFITTVVKMRAPGLTWRRVPIFTWSILFTAILSLIFTQAIAVALSMTIFDRVAGGAFFDPVLGGIPVLYQHIFWFYSHPAVYVMVLPSLGAMLEILPVFSRKPLFAYKWAVGGIIGISTLSALVWAHHMFTVDADSPSNIGFMFTTEAISVPTGLIFLAAVGTIWRGRLWLKTPMLFALAVIFNFLIGGVTGVFLSDVPADVQLQDTFWVVAHFHYTIVGGGIFGLFAGIYYWFPKMTGRLLNERLGKIHFWIMFIGFNATFIPMFWLGINGMNRRIADYQPALEGANRFTSLAGFFLGISFIFFVWNAIVSWRNGEVAGPNPWGARTLEWVTTSPPPELNFDGEPEVTGDPYGYGSEQPAHAVIHAPERGDS
jgi:cytochrome c oxidase subunit I